MDLLCEWIQGRGSVRAGLDALRSIGWSQFVHTGTSTKKVPVSASLGTATSFIGGAPNLP